MSFQLLEDDVLRTLPFMSNTKSWKRRSYFDWVCCICGSPLLGISNVCTTCFRPCCGYQQRLHVTWELDTRSVDSLTGPAVLYDDDSDSEGLFGKHKRSPVMKKHIEPCGKYRSICKLFITFDGASMEATGWCCIENGVVATAGHNVFDKEYGPAVAITAHIGYHGPQSDLRKTHEVRVAALVAVHRGWHDKLLRQNDIALIQLKTPFDEVLPLKWKDCPQRGEGLAVGVVGYPGDVPGGSKGQYMYESIGSASWDLEKHDVLIHRLDTFRGTSGSPIFRFEDGQEPAVIGVHASAGTIPRSSSGNQSPRGMGPMYRVNKGVAIGHKGNSICELRHAMTFHKLGNPRSDTLANGHASWQQARVQTRVVIR